MPSEIKRWKCDHCKKHFASEKYTINHEKRCFFNTNNKACPTCLCFNDSFKVEYSECVRYLGTKSITRRGTDRNLSGSRKYNVFTEFCKWDCKHWKSRYEVEEEDCT